jgi:hypothetical protein
MIPYDFQAKEIRSSDRKTGAWALDELWWDDVQSVQIKESSLMPSRGPNNI